MTDFLSIRSASLHVQISPFGAALARVWLTGHDLSLVLGLQRPEDYATAPQAIGVIVGPIAGRVSGARTVINGQEFVMEPNTPPDCLHSGQNGVQHRLWSVEEHCADRLTLRCDLTDGDCGLPGNRVLRATYAVQDHNLTLEITASSDADTLVNATNHAYWVLDGSGGLDHHMLSLPTTQMCETGSDMVPTGRIIDIHDTDFDFTSPKNPVAGPNLDACFCLRNEPTNELAPALKLTSQMSGISLDVHTNQPGVVVYSGADLTPMAAPSKTPSIAPFSALAIEAQGWPDANNHARFPGILVKSGTVSRQITQFSLHLP